MQEDGNTNDENLGKGMRNIALKDIKHTKKSFRKKILAYQKDRQINEVE